MGQCIVYVGERGRRSQEPSVSSPHQRPCFCSHSGVLMISEMAPGSSPRFLYCFITENRKHPSSPECLVSVQKVMEGSELELAKVSSLAEPSLNTVGALFLGFEVSMSSHLAGAEANLNPRILGARATQQRFTRPLLWGSETGRNQGSPSCWHIFLFILSSISGCWPKRVP